MADVHAEQACQTIQVLVAIGVVEVAALAAFDDRQGVGVPGPLLREMRNQVLLGQLPRRAHGFSVWMLMGYHDVLGRTLLRTVSRVTGVT